MEVLYARWQPKRRMCFTGLPVCAIRIQAVIEDLCTSSTQEYAVMLALILVLVVGTVRLIGSNANTAFSSVASSLQ